MKRTMKEKEGKMEDYSVLSLVFLALSITLAFVLKKNTGIIAIAFSLLLGRLAGIPDKTVIKGFNTSLFIMLLGLTYLFSIAENNKTLELLARKIIHLFRDKIRLLPFVLFGIGALLSGIGPGPVSVSGIIGALSISIAVELQIAPISLAPFGALGAFSTGLASITPSGVVAISLAEENGMLGFAKPLLFSTFSEMFLYSMVLYFFAFKWPTMDIKNSVLSDTAVESFNKEQWITLAGVAVTIALTLIFDVQIGLSALSVALLISIICKRKESADISLIPLGTLLMICGVGVLIELITSVGGIDLMSKFLSDHLTEKLVTPIMTLLGGMLSWVSSASGVVMPTLIPTVPGITESLAGTDPYPITIGICIGAHAAAISPLSSCGAMILASYTSIAKASPDERDTMFKKLFILSAGGVLFSVFLSAIGCYSLFL